MVCRELKRTERRFKDFSVAPANLVRKAVASLRKNGIGASSVTLLSNLSEDGCRSDRPHLLSCSRAQGRMTRPRNRMLPETSSRIRNRKGWSALNTGGGSGMETAPRVIITAVAAAASVPFSFTST